jgi:dTDP-4-dehydrorhamnose reductase
MKIVVAGAKGQVGQEIMRLGNVEAQSHTEDYTLIGFTSHELDISDLAQVELQLKAHRPNVVINAAAYTAVDTAETETECAYAVNQRGPENLAKVCKTLGILLIHLSTDYVFDGEQNRPYGENDIPNPTGIYGLSKLRGEKAVQANLHAHYIVRVAWVFGAHGNNFVKTMLRLANERDSLSIVDDQIGGPTWAKDIAKLVIHMALRSASTEDQSEDSLPYGTYHYTGNKNVSWYTFATCIFEKAYPLGLIKKIPKLTPITTAAYPTPAKRPKNSCLCCTKIQQNSNLTLSNWEQALDSVLKTWTTQ